MNKVHQLQMVKGNQQNPPKNLSLQKARTAHTRHAQEGLARDPCTLRTILFKERFSAFVIDTLLSFILPHFDYFADKERLSVYIKKKKRACNNACSM